MLPKSNRLPSSEIRTVMRRGKRIVNASIQLIFLPNQVGTPRFAFVVATSVDKRATKRNRLKRLMREAAYRLLAQIRGSVDAVVIARSTREGEIENSVGELLHKAELL